MRVGSTSTLCLAIFLKSSIPEMIKEMLAETAKAVSVMLLVATSKMSSEEPISK